MHVFVPAFKHLLLLSEQGVASAARASLGQSGLMPSQKSSTSQSPFLGRHSTQVSLTASCVGQALLMPSQNSGKSHSLPATAPRHCPLVSFFLSSHPGL